MPRPYGIVGYTNGIGSLTHRTGEEIMATAVVNQGKTPFVEKYFASHPDGNLESVNEAWTAAGNAGSLSESLVGKVRARLGLTGKKKIDASKPIEAPAEPKK